MEQVSKHDEDRAGKRWRENAAAVVINPRREVLLCRAKGKQAYWHCPQGGLRASESPEDALKREIWEETSLMPHQYSVRRKLSDLKYFYPETHQKRARWIGQSQTWFLLECHEAKPAIDFGYSGEFAEYRWVKVEEIELDDFSPQKRGVLLRVLRVFFPEWAKSGKANPSAVGDDADLAQGITHEARSRGGERDGKRAGSKKRSSGGRDLQGSPEQDSRDWQQQGIPGANADEEAEARGSGRFPVSSTGDDDSFHVQERVKNMPKFEKYLVRPGRGLEWENHDPLDETFFEGSKAEGQAEFDALKTQLQYLQKLLFAENRNKLLVIIQAMDAGGKDGLIKSVFSKLDPQGLRVTAFKKPTPEELSRDFLWRIHQVVPANGEIGVFNRSHYEDIIAVRVKNILPEAQWRRRYRHIVDFEKMLADEGTMVVKIFLHISREEQKARLESRLTDPSKTWKFQKDDLTDRQRWPMFMDAYREIIQHTSTPQTPWYIIPSDRKWYRNLMVAQLLVNKLTALDMKFPEPSFDPTKIVIPD